MYSKRLLVILALLTGACAGRFAMAQHPHGEHGKLVQFVTPTDIKSAVREIDHRMHEISELIALKELEQVHSQADVIQKVGRVIGQLALKPDSGVPTEAVKELNVAGKELAAKFDAIDKAADSDDVAGTRKVYAEMQKLVEVLHKYVPKEYTCPMRCEGEKSYTAPGKCPKCGMNLSELKAHMDHQPKHGGIFFMAPDQKHHLEGTLSKEGEFRIYFYDEFTRPIPAAKFEAEAKFWPKGADESARQPLVLTLNPEKAFLSGRLTIDPPLSVKAYIDFRDGQRPQVFDFDFDRPSETPAGQAG
jgi:hypothetical protein